MRCIFYYYYIKGTLSWILQKSFAGRYVQDWEGFENIQKVLHILAATINTLHQEQSQFEASVSEIVRGTVYFWY